MKNNLKERKKKFNFENKIKQKKYFPYAKNVFISTPSWGNHNPIMTDSGFTVKQYRYYQPSTKGFDFKGCLEDINVTHFFYLKFNFPKITF